MKILGIIPARYESSRFPGKPLANIAGKPMIQHVYERAIKARSLSSVVVATDDLRIADVVTGFGGKAIMTKKEHPSGTDRCYEAYLKQDEDCDVIINIQGDEPEFDPQQIELLCNCFTNPKVDIATLIMPINDGNVLTNNNKMKVVKTVDDFALYFSRTAIPFQRGVPLEDWLKNHTYYSHIGIYAYRSSVLGKITSLPPSLLENAERLEQLRWLENGYRIKVAITKSDSDSIDTKADLERLLQRLKVQ